jgi:hypothetical protein
MVVRKVAKKVSVRRGHQPRASTQIADDVIALERALAEKKKVLEAIKIVEASGMVVAAPRAPTPRAVRKARAAKPFVGKAIIDNITKPVLVVPRAQRNLEQREYGRVVWSEEMWKVLKEQKQGISYADLLAELVKNPELGNNRSKGNKGFYQAIRRLTQAGDVEKIGGLLYTKALAKSLRARGDALPQSHPTPGRNGGARSIILALLTNYPGGLTGSQIKEIAAKHPDAPSSLRSDSHYIYNVLGGLKKKGEIAKDGELYKTTALAEARSVH